MDDEKQFRREQEAQLNFAYATSFKEIYEIIERVPPTHYLVDSARNKLVRADVLANIDVVSQLCNNDQLVAASHLKGLTSKYGLRDAGCRIIAATVERNFQSCFTRAGSPIDSLIDVLKRVSEQNHAFQSLGVNETIRVVLKDEKEDPIDLAIYIANLAYIKDILNQPPDFENERAKKVREVVAKFTNRYDIRNNVENRAKFRISADETLTFSKV